MNKWFVLKDGLKERSLKTEAFSQISDITASLFSHVTYVSALSVRSVHHMIK